MSTHDEKSEKSPREKSPHEAARTTSPHADELLWQLIHDNAHCDVRRAVNRADFDKAPLNEAPLSEDRVLDAFSARAFECAETSPLLEISGAVRHDFDDSDAQAPKIEAARAAFAPVHAQLMNAIERDVATDRAATDQVANNSACRRTDSRHFQSLLCVIGWRSFDWRLGRKWAAPATALLLTAIGGHSLGLYRASQNEWSQRAVADEESSLLNADGVRNHATRVLPVQSLVDEFDSSLRRSAPLEFVADERESPQSAAWRLQKQLGVSLRLPLKPQKGVKLLGALRQKSWHRPGVQARYIKNGVRVAVYQMREPACGMGNLREVEWQGQLFMTGDRGAYRVVAWRADDDVMTLVSPLAMQPHDSLLLAQQMRHTANGK